MNLSNFELLNSVLEGRAQDNPENYHQFYHITNPDRYIERCCKKGLYNLALYLIQNTKCYTAEDLEKGVKILIRQNKPNIIEKISFDDKEMLIRLWKYSKRYSHLNCSKEIAIKLAREKYTQPIDYMLRKKELDFAIKLGQIIVNGYYYISPLDKYTNELYEKFKGFSGTKDNLIQMIPKRDEKLYKFKNDT